MQRHFLGLFCIGTFMVLFPVKVHAIPIFARLYKTSCVTCHDVFPHLNAFGIAFKNRGYRYPKGLQKKSDSRNKLKMGSPAYKKMWPEAIWPTDIPLLFPIAAHFSARYASRDAPEGNSTFTIPAKTDFLFAATFDESFSLFAEMEMNTANEIDFDFRFQYTFSPAINITLGKVGPAYWLRDHYRLTETPYYWANGQNSSKTWRFNDGTNGGIELWGSVENIQNGGGLTYALGVGNGQSNSQKIDVNNHKDYYFYASYKLGGVGVLGSIEEKGKKEMNDYDTHLKVDVFYYNGLSTKLKKNDAFIVYGGGISGKWRTFRFAAGSVFVHSRFYLQNLRQSNIFVTIGHAIYPWLWGLARYERQKSFVGTFNKTESRMVPAVVALIRANIRASAEYLAGLGHNPNGGLRLNLNFAF